MEDDKKKKKIKVFLQNFKKIFVEILHGSVKFLFKEFYQCCDTKLTKKGIKDVSIKILKFISN